MHKCTPFQPHIFLWLIHFACLLQKFINKYEQKYITTNLCQQNKLNGLSNDKECEHIFTLLYNKCIYCSYRCTQFFTARCYASAVLAMALCPSICPSITSRCSTKTAKHRITQTTLHDSPGTLVFWCQRSPWNSTGVTPYGGTKCRWGGSKSATFHK